MAEKQEKHTLRGDLQKLIEQGAISEKELYGSEGEEEGVEKDAKNDDVPAMERMLTLVKENDPSFAARFQQREKALIGFIEDLPKATIPETSAENPFVIPLKNPTYPRVMVINATCVGTRKSADSLCEIFSNALRWAEEIPCDAVILTGPIIYFPTEKYGKERPSKIQVVDVEVDKDIIEKSYPKQVLEALGGVEQIRKEGRPIFLTTTMYLEHLMRMFKRLVHDEKGDLLFHGPILCVLGDVEENIAKYYANEKVRIAVFREKGFAAKQIARLKRLQRLVKTISSAEIIKEAASFLEKLVKKIIPQATELGVDFETLQHLETDELEKQIQDWEQYRDLLALMGNVEPPFIQERLPEMISYIASCFEAIAPNIKVVGMGDAYFKKGSHLVGVTSDKYRNRIKGGLAGEKRHAMYSYVKGHPGESVVDLNLGPGLNPYLDTLFVTHRVRAYEKTLDDVRMSHVYQLPACLDSSLYRDVVRHMARTKDDITKLASVANYESGVIILERGEQSSIPAIKMLTSAVLTNRAIFSSRENLAAAVHGKFRRSQMIWIYKEGCVHSGAQHIARYRSPKDPHKRVVKYHYQVAFEMLEANKAPIIMYASDGDKQHWYNYAVHREGNSAYKTPEELFHAMMEIEENHRLTKKEKEETLRMLILEQRILGGVLQPQQQIKAYVASLDPCLEFFRNTIMRARERGLAVEGRVGIITDGQGNHNSQTWKKSDVRFDEATWTRTELLLKLVLTYPELADVLPEALCAAEFDGLGEARGLFGISPSLGLGSGKQKKKLATRTNANFYAFYMLHKQGSSKTKDNMKSMVEGFAWIGTADQYEVDHFCFNTAGDDHMGGFAVTRSAMHVKTGCQMFEGPFGRLLRFPEQNIFSAVCGLPAGGKEWGPLVFIPLDYRAIRKYAYKPFPLELELFENSLQPLPSNKQKENVTAVEE